MRSSVSHAFIKMTVLIIEKAWLLIMAIMKLMKILKHGPDGLAIDIMVWQLVHGY